MSNIVTTNVSDVPIKDKQLLIDPENGELYFDHGGTRVKLGGSESPVSSVNGKTGEVVLGADDVGATPEMEYCDFDADVDISDSTAEVWGYDLAAGKYYRSASGKALNILLDFQSIPTSLVEIVIEITMGDTGGLGFPADLQWVSEPTFESGKTYVVSIVNNIAVATEVTA